MTSERPYRKAMTKQAAIEELKRVSGSQFDPAIVKILLKKLSKEDK
jgi:HD-GYP domain-containing protein (c-di-GMP phosphodiesterase class II)